MERSELHDKLGRWPIRATIVALAVAIPALLRADVDTVVRAPIRGNGVVAEREALNAARARAALQQMDLATRAGQVIMSSVPGTSLKPAQRRVLARLRLGGVIIFTSNVRGMTQLARLNRSVQRAGVAGRTTAPRILIAVDQEGGAVSRIDGIAPTMTHRQLGRVDRPDITRAQGAATGRALRRLGIGMDLAPVADLDLPPHVLGARTFGSSPERVTIHAGAFVAGLQSEGVGAAVKHFPGFGGAPVNSDDDVARIDRTSQQLRRDLAPYRSAGIRTSDAIMVSHGIYASLDRLRPASISPRVYQLLRDEPIAYRGVAITDSLHAAGSLAGTRGGIAASCVATVAAGADMALLTGSLSDAVRCRAALARAVRTGQLPRARLDEAALRVLTLKARRGLLAPEPDEAATRLG